MSRPARLRVCTVIGFGSGCLLFAVLSAGTGFGEPAYALGSAAGFAIGLWWGAKDAAFHG